MTWRSEVPWEKRFFKGDEVWVEVDDEGDFILEDGRVPMKYEREGGNIYHAHPSNVSREDESAEDAWARRLQEREDALDRRERELDTREKKLDQREEALTDWEQRLKSGALEEEPEADAAAEGTDDPWFDAISPTDDIGPDAAIVAGSDQTPESVSGAPSTVDGIVEIHTDGACSGNPGPCGFGVTVRVDGAYHELSAFIGEGTNNIAELMAIKIGLLSVPDRSRPVRLYSDSRYSIGVLTKGWKAKANRELILEIRSLIDEFEDLELRKVEGHSGDPLNERADDLARDAVQAHK
jgi:ribonuclease HI